MEGRDTSGGGRMGSKVWVWVWGKGSSKEIWFWERWERFLGKSVGLADKDSGLLSTDKGGTPKGVWAEDWCGQKCSISQADRAGIQRRRRGPRKTIARRAAGV